MSSIKGCGPAKIAHVFTKNDYQQLNCLCVCYFFLLSTHTTTLIRNCHVVLYLMITNLQKKEIKFFKKMSALLFRCSLCEDRGERSLKFLERCKTVHQRLTPAGSSLLDNYSLFNILSDGFINEATSHLKGFWHTPTCNDDSFKHFPWIPPDTMPFHIHISTVSSMHGNTN